MSWPQRSLAALGMTAIPGSIVSLQALVLSRFSNSTLPRPPSAQMLTMARWPWPSVASSLTAWLMMRAPVAPNGWPSAVAAAVGVHPFLREGAEVARHPGAVAQEDGILQRLQVEGDLGRRRPRGFPRGGCRRSAGRGARAGAGWRRPAPSAALRRGNRARRSPSRPALPAASWRAGVPVPSTRPPRSPPHRRSAARNCRPVSVPLPLVRSKVGPSLASFSSEVSWARNGVAA